MYGQNHIKVYMEARYTGRAQAPQPNSFAPGRRCPRLDDNLEGVLSVLGIML